MARSIARDHDEKRAALLKTAAKFFARHGFDRASMSELAKACGVSKALIYHYHDSKDALLHGILHAHMTKLIGSVEELDLPDDPQARLHLLARTLVLAYRDADAEHKLLLDALEALPDDKQREIKDMERRLVGIMAKAVADNAPDLFAARPEILKPVTMSAFGMLNWLYTWHREGAGLSREAYAALAAELLIGGLQRIAAGESASRIPAEGQAVR